MNRSSPTLEGFRVILRVPSLGLAEIAWRWSFGCAVLLLLLLALREYLATLPVTAGEMLLLSTQNPALISHAIAQIFRGSAERALAASFVIAAMMAIAWVILASLARAAAVLAVAEYFRLRDRPSAHHEEESLGCDLQSLLNLNLLRLAVTAAAALGCIGTMLLAGAASSSVRPSPGGALLIMAVLFSTIILVWSGLNWLLGVGSIFTSAERKNTFSALRSAVGLMQSRPGALAAASLWFGIARGITLVVAASMTIFWIALARLLPAGIIFAGLLLILLLYFAAADFLHLGRLAAYTYAAIGPADSGPAVAREYPLANDPPDSAVDQQELILSDVPQRLAPA